MNDFQYYGLMFMLAMIINNMSDNSKFKKLTMISASMFLILQILSI